MPISRYAYAPGYAYEQDYAYEPGYAYEPAPTYYYGPAQGSYNRGYRNSSSGSNCGTSPASLNAGNC